MKNTESKPPQLAYGYVEINGLCRSLAEKRPSVDVTARAVLDKGFPFP